LKSKRSTLTVNPQRPTLNAQLEHKTRGTKYPCDRNAERDTETYADAKGGIDAEAAPDAGASPVKMLMSDR
jgi:hypothetical protein